MKTAYDIPSRLETILRIRAAMADEEAGVDLDAHARRTAEFICQVRRQTMIRENRAAHDCVQAFSTRVEEFLSEHKL